MNGSGTPSQDYEPELSGQAPRPGVGDFEELKQALANEKAAPEILQYEQDVVLNIQERLKMQADRVREWTGEPAMDLPRRIYIHEEYRVKYLLRSYLRTRLRKIQKYAMHILDDPDQHSRLSDEELEYTKSYCLMVGKHMKEMLLQHLPRNFDNLIKQSSASETKDMLERPDLDHHTFCRVLSDLGAIPVDEHGIREAQFSKGDQYACRYGVIRDLLRDKHVELI